MTTAKKPSSRAIPQEEREEKLRNELQAFIDEHGLTRTGLVDTVKLRQEDANLKNRLCTYADRFYGTTSVHTAINKLGFSSNSHGKYKKEDIETLTQELFTEEQARAIFEQEGAYNIDDLFIKKGKEGQLALEEINNRKSTQYTKKNWESFIDSLHPNIQHKYGITLSEAIRGKPRFTDARISKDLYELLTSKQNISSQGLKQIKPFGVSLSNAINYKPPFGVTNHRVKFNGKKGFRLAKKIPPEFHKNSKEIDVGYKTISKEEVQFMLEIARIYDPKLERLTALKGLFEKGIAAVHTGEAWTSYKTDVHRVENPSLVNQTDFRIETRNGTNVLLDVDVIQAYANDKEEGRRARMAHANSSHLKLGYFGRIPHSLWNNRSEIEYAKEWLTGETINKKVIISNCPPEEAIERGLLMEQERGIRVIHSNEARKAYEKSLELLLEEEPNFFGAASTNYEFMDKVISYLRTYLPKISKWHLIRPGREPSTTLGAIAEEEIKFIFNTAKKFPEANIPHVGDFIKEKIQTIHDTSQQEKINIASELYSPKADIRIITEEGDYLIEVKKLSVIKKDHRDDIIKKYCMAYNWEDRKPITDKLLIFNSSTKGLEGDKQEFEDIGFTVWNGREVREAYEASIDTVLAQQPTFLTDINSPIPGSTENGKATLLQIHGDINDYAHIMSRNGNRSYRQWSLQLLKNINKGVSKGARPNRKGRTHLRELENEYVIPFEKAQVLYPNIDLDFLIQDQFVFLDLETAGFNRSGEPIIVNALAYNNGKEMVVHQLVSRTPAEEERMLGRYTEIADNKTIVTYSGIWFDSPFLNERFIAKGIQPPNINHIDLRKVYSRHLQKQGLDYPHEKLQTYEQLELGIHRRSDVKGAIIPGLYKEYLETGNAKALIHILQHSLPDMVTMGVMFKHFDKEGVLPLAKNYQQATLF